MIVGAGLAGLVCAANLHRTGVPVLVLEASDGVGGRVRTDVVDGFRIDRGFQVLMTSYPEARIQLDLDALRLGAFEPGAEVRIGTKSWFVADPLRRPGSLWSTLTAPIGSLGDKLAIARLRRRMATEPLEEILARPATSTREHLRGLGFSERIVERFFEPFHGGVLLDRELASSSRMFEFTFACFTRGDAVLPHDGMGAIPRQLAERIPAESLRLDTPIDGLGPDHVVTRAGERIDAAAVVVATDGGTAASLLGRSVPKPQWKGVTLVAFAANSVPLRRKAIVLRGQRDAGPVAHLCVPNRVAPGYAPAGQDLVYCTVLDGDQERGVGSSLEDRVRAQLVAWFGAAAKSWHHLATRRIAHALPELTADPVEQPARLDDGVFVCGDHRDTASIQGAMRSGRRAAEAVIAAHYSES